MKKTLAASSIFILFLFSGGIWLSVVNFLPSGTLRTWAIVLFGISFAVVFLWLLIVRLRILLGDTDHLVRDVVLIVFNLALLVLAFAWEYQMLGLIDNTAPDQPVVHSFTSSVYYSIITLTTVGYGDFYPVGPGRALAAIQGITGYIILGLLASSVASIISPREKPLQAEAYQETT